MPSYVVKWLIMFNASIIYFVILFANQASYFSSYSYILPTLFPLVSRFIEKSCPILVLFRVKKSARFQLQTSVAFISSYSSFFSALPRHFLFCTFCAKEVNGKERRERCFLRWFLRFRDILFTFCITTNKRFDKRKRNKKTNKNKTLTRVSVNYCRRRLCMLIYKLCCVYESCQNGKKI